MKTKTISKLSTSALAIIALVVFGATNIKARPGDLDPIFSGDGKLTDGVLSNLPDTAYGVAVQPDGKIVVAGSVGRGFGVARYNTDGSLDNSFGIGGQVYTPDGFARAVAIQPDGRIVVAGSMNSCFALVRLNPDGSFDLP
jgi:uncharacterized delta-60 repeat protein